MKALITLFAAVGGLLISQITLASICMFNEASVRLCPSVESIAKFCKKEYPCEYKVEAKTMANLIYCWGTVCFSGKAKGKPVVLDSSRVTNEDGTLECTYSYQQQSPSTFTLRLKPKAPYNCVRDVDNGHFCCRVG